MENNILSQDITSEESKSLVASSNSSNSAQGANTISMSQTGLPKVCHDAKWYYFFALDRERERYLDMLTGKKPVVIRQDDGSREECRYNMRVFSYTYSEHRRRFENFTYSSDEYDKRKKSATNVRKAFTSESPETFNTFIDNSQTRGDGYIFVCGNLHDINLVLGSQFPRKYLITNKYTRTPEEIPSMQMEEFIYLYESMPYKIELMEHPLDEYTLKHKNIRITGGIFAGKVGKIMRIHKCHKLVFAFGNMTVAINNIHAFPYEVI